VYKRRVKIDKAQKVSDCLVDAGLIDQKTVANALEIQKVQSKKLGQVLIDMGVADDHEIAKALAKQLDIPLLNLLEAMKLAIQENPDLIITDFLMPKMDGVTLIKKLKSYHLNN